MIAPARTPEEIREGRRTRQRLRQHTPESKAYHKAWRKANQDKVRAWPSKSKKYNNAQLRAWYDNNPERVQARRLREYSLTRENYDALVAKQGNRCAICNAPPTGKKPLGIDHHHASGKVRALLCNRCNLRVGVLEIPAFPALLQYLCQHHPEFREKVLSVVQ